MAILKMKFISIVGRKDYFEEFALNHVVNSGIELVDAMSKLENVKGLTRFTDEEMHRDLMKRVMDIAEYVGIKKRDLNLPINCNLHYTASQLENEISAIEMAIKEHEELKKKYQDDINRYFHMQKQIELLNGIDVDLESFFNFEFIKFRFGKMPNKSYKQLQLYIDDLEAIVYTISHDDDYTWLIYFTPRVYSEKVDSIFSSLYFEREWLPSEFRGTPSEVLIQLKDKLYELQNEQRKLEENIKVFSKSVRDKITTFYAAATQINLLSEIRKHAACTRESFYITGWIPEKEFNALKPILDSDKKIMYILEEPDMLKSLKPPTELKNNPLFKPFETFVRMYGLPAYNEIDPTSFVAITYSFIFGIMFGDVGQGLCLFIGGLLIYLTKKMNLAAIVALAGVFSTLFGFMYGSIFGFESILKPLWLSPRENVMTMLITSVAFGVFLILVAMIINIINSIKAKDWGKVFFDTNGLAGLLFYAALISSVALIFTGHSLPGALILAVFFGIPLLLMFFKEPLTHWVEKKSKIFPEHKAMFFLESFFELFEVLLSYLTNTISFLRVGAFALSHAGMMAVVMLLAGAEHGGSPNIVVLVLGNAFVCLLEGLIVGIQVLRLEYYEMFSRFYRGNGKEFKPYKYK